MITGKINLSALKHVQMEVEGQNGKVKGMFIPYEANRLFVGEKSVSLDIIAFDSPKPEYKQTHAVKQSFSKEVREKMSEEEQKALPFIGSLNANVGGAAPVENNPAPAQVFNPTDKLPF